MSRTIRRYLSILAILTIVVGIGLVLAGCATTARTTSPVVASTDEAIDVPEVEDLSGSPENYPPSPLEKSLLWLASVQSPDGSWYGNRSHTGLALLVFLANGETPISEQYGETVTNAMKWLSYGVNEHPELGTATENGIATYALAEAYGMTRIPFLKVAMERGLERVLAGQQPGGGFDVDYAQGDHWDLAVAGWQFQALKAASYSADVDTPRLRDAVTRAVAFLKTTAYADGRFYRFPGGTGESLPGVGALSLQIFGERKSPEAQAALALVVSERLDLYRTFQDGRADFRQAAGPHIRGWYYDTQVCFNTHGKAWTEWSKVFESVLVANQNPAGYWEAAMPVSLGEPMSVTGDVGESGRVLTTTLCILQFPRPSRHLPCFEIRKMEKSTNKGQLDDVETGLKIE